MSKIPDVQAAVRALDGVRHASVRWPEPQGPATLRVEFVDSADREQVTASVLATLREIGGVDLESLQLSGRPPGGPSPEGSGRPIFVGLSVDRRDLDASVTVRLESGNRRMEGCARGLATERATLRTAAEAALDALASILPDDARVALEWVQLVEPVEGTPALVTSAVAYLGSDGEEAFVGTALVRHDPREAAVRATLDALNRRLARLDARAVTGQP